MEWFNISVCHIGRYLPICVCLYFHFPRYYCTVKIDSCSLRLWWPCVVLYIENPLWRQFSDYVSFLPSGLNKDKIRKLFKSCVFVYPIFFWFITFRWNYEKRKWKDVFRIVQNESILVHIKLIAGPVHQYLKIRKHW